MADNPTSCGRCNAPNPPENRFCGQCGHAIQDKTPLAGPPGTRPGVLPARITGDGRLKALLGGVGKPLAFGALTLLAEVLVEAGTRRLGQRAGGDTKALPVRQGSADDLPERALPELKYYEELIIVAQDGTRVTKFFGKRSIFGPPGGRE